jgi:hypothetical protein
MAFLLALIVAQATYEERARAADALIAEERLRIAAEFESMKAWAWARAEYRKILRLAPDSDVSRKFSSSEGIPLGNAKGVPTQRYHDLMGEVSKVAAAKHSELARWCEENGHPEQATAHWRWTLLHSPGHVDAIAALGLVGSGASARDAIWKDAPWKRPLEKADAGEPVEEEGALEAAWKVKTLKRKSGELEWEALGLSDEHLMRVVRQANAVLDFMRLALGDNAQLPHPTRYVLLADKARYRAYVDEFTDKDEGEKARLRSSGYFYNSSRLEQVQRGDEADDRHEHLAVSTMGQRTLWRFVGRWPAHWFAEATGNTCEILFRGKSEIFSSLPPTGTGTGDSEHKNWEDSSKWDAQLRTVVTRRIDPSMEEIVGIQLNAMRPVHAAKGASVVRFLMLRRPSLYRSLAESFRTTSDTPRAGVEKALGFTLEELDEFWRRWIVTQ